jgi:hypothetical protein
LKNFIQYIRDYLLALHPLVLLLTVVITAFSVWVNYHWDLNAQVYKLNEAGEFGAWFLVFFFLFGLIYAIQSIIKKSSYFNDKGFIFLLLVAPAIFAWKMSADVFFNLSHRASYNLYLNQVIYWPFKVFIITAVLFIIWRTNNKGEPFYGLQAKQYNWRPYLWMLVVMLPLIALASTQPDFLATYPKYQKLSFLKSNNASIGHFLLFELAYGSDFFSIELFFRGFLILGFMKYAGRDTILPMAVFYCAIHFGKPLGECISSFFGGILLGIITYNTRSIWGGLVVHLGIAWLMELGGYLGKLLK